jgi:GTP-binding protein
MPKNVVFFGSYNDVKKIPKDPRPQIAFAGRSNVGKSSLLNKITGQKKLAKTSKTPGRTRRIDFFLADDRYFLVDLPGYGYVAAGIDARQKWGKLVEGFLNLSSLSGMVMLLDCRREPTDDDLMMIEWLDSRDINYIIALTKADKVNRGPLKSKQLQVATEFHHEVIPFSAVSGLGKKELVHWIEGIV